MDNSIKSAALGAFLSASATASAIPNEFSPEICKLNEQMTSKINSCFEPDKWRCWRKWYETNLTDLWNWRYRIEIPEWATSMSAFEKSRLKDIYPDNDNKEAWFQTKLRMSEEANSKGWYIEYSVVFWKEDWDNWIGWDSFGNWWKLGAWFGFWTSPTWCKSTDWGSTYRFWFAKYWEIVWIYYWEDADNDYKCWDKHHTGVKIKEWEENVFWLWYKISDDWKTYTMHMYLNWELIHSRDEIQYYPGDVDMRIQFFRWWKWINDYNYHKPVNIEIWDIKYYSCWMQN